MMSLCYGKWVSKVDRCVLPRGMAVECGGVMVIHRMSERYPRGAAVAAVAVAWLSG
jgi:hypothetical protein